MRFGTILPLVLIVAGLLTAPAAEAAWGSAVGRNSGFGWGDGYHSRANCPRGHHTCQAKPAPTPWWATPSPAAEYLPQPAGQPTPAPEMAVPANGASLFRQPGEGSSLMVSPAR